MKSLTEKQLDKLIEKGKWVRAGGECICPVCGKEYIRHLRLEPKYPWLNKICTGLIVKL